MDIDVAQIKTCLDNIQLPGILVKDSTALLDQVSQDEVKEAIASLNYQWSLEKNGLGLIFVKMLRSLSKKKKISNTEIIVLKRILMAFE